MFELVKITDLKGNLKDNMFNEIKKLHDVYGTLDTFGIGKSFMFHYKNDEWYALRSSTVSKIEENENECVITTRNSIYYFVKS